MVELGTLEAIGAAIEDSVPFGGGGGGGDQKHAVIVSSPLGDTSPSSIIKIIGQVLPIVISFFTNSFLEEILEDRTGFEILSIIFLSLFLWVLVADAIRSLWSSVDEGRAGWSATWVMLVDFISLILVLMTAQYGSTLLREDWALVGISSAELVAFGIFFALLFLPSYLFLLKVYA